MDDIFKQAVDQQNVEVIKFLASNLDYGLVVYKLVIRNELQLLKEVFSEEYKDKDLDYQFLLSEIVKFGYLSLLEYFLSHVPQSLKNLDNGDQLLPIAVSHGHFNIVKYIITNLNISILPNIDPDNKTDINDYLIEKLYNGFTPL